MQRCGGSVGWYGGGGRGGERKRERERVRLIVGSRDPGRSSGAGRFSGEAEVAVKNFPVDVWWPVYEANGAHFAVFGCRGWFTRECTAGWVTDGMSRVHDVCKPRVESKRGAGEGEGLAGREVGSVGRGARVEGRGARGRGRGMGERVGEEVEVVVVAVGGQKVRVFVGASG